MGYFAMAADLGWIAVDVEFVRGDWSGSDHHPTRQVFWVRYLSWYVCLMLGRLKTNTYYTCADFQSGLSQPRC